MLRGPLLWLSGHHSSAARPRLCGALHIGLPLPFDGVPQSWPLWHRWHVWIWEYEWIYDSWRRKQTGQALSWKQDSSILGWAIQTLDYMPSIYGSGIPTGKPIPHHGRAPRVRIPFHGGLKERILVICVLNRIHAFSLFIFIKFPEELNPKMKKERYNPKLTRDHMP